MVTYLSTNLLNQIQIATGTAIVADIINKQYFAFILSFEKKTIFTKSIVKIRGRSAIAVILERIRIVTPIVIDNK